MTSSEGATRDLAWLPDACTLPTAERPLRLSEFDDLFANAVESSDRLGREHLRLVLSGQANLQATVADLVARESECCSFFAFNVDSPTTGRVVLDIQVPVEHVDVLDGLARRAVGFSRSGS